jgi:hypothetical protein
MNNHEYFITVVCGMILIVMVSFCYTMWVIHVLYAYWRRPPSLEQSLLPPTTPAPKRKKKKKKKRDIEIGAGVGDLYAIPEAPNEDLIV